MMPASLRRIRAGVAVLLLAASAAFACGTDFPWQLLGCRSQTLDDLPVDSFYFAVRHLVPRPDPRLPMLAADFRDDVDNEEGNLLPADQRARVKTMRAQSTASAALRAGAGLAAPVRLYVSGAVAFLDDDFAGAERLFREAATASDGGRDPMRLVWSTYMLGRTLGVKGDDPGAVAGFVRVRTLVAAGAPDPLGLAPASFGQQALLSLAASRLPMRRIPDTTTDGVPDRAQHDRRPPDPARLAALHEAVRLYAGQAALGDDGGVASLRFVAEALLAGTAPADAWLATACRDLLLRHLVVAYTLSDVGTLKGDVEQDQQGQVEPDQTGFNASLDPEPTAARLLDRLAAAIGAGAAPDGEDAGRLAAIAYTIGRYELAQRFVADAPGPLAAWVRAKLSLQDDDAAATVRAYDAAIRAAAAGPDRLQPATAARLRADAAVYDVSRGDFETALRILAREGATYWGDVAYVAERLLTTDQLRRTVAAHVPAVPVVLDYDDTGTTSFPQGYDGHPAFDPPRALRDLLARRLMRDGRFAEAEATFTSVALQRYAAQYADALDRARRAFWRTDRAQAAWTTATLARLYGMRLLGTELQPDLHVVQGQYDFGWGPDQRPATVGSHGTVSRLEQIRFDDSAPAPNLRFHYRDVAAGDAALAASLLPPRSQAYAAVLCRASQWMFQNDEAQAADAFYRQYVAHGAAGPFAAHFGGTCPSPDFAAAARLRWTLPLRQALGPVRRHRWPAAIVVAVGTGLALALVAAVGRARRRRADA